MQMLPVGTRQRNLWRANTVHGNRRPEEVPAAQAQQSAASLAAARRGCFQPHARRRPTTDDLTFPAHVRLAFARTLSAQSMRRKARAYQWHGNAHSPPRPCQRKAT
jgi:hypothetical protein